MSKRAHEEREFGFFRLWFGNVVAKVLFVDWGLCLNGVWGRGLTDLFSCAIARC